MIDIDIKCALMIKTSQILNLNYFVASEYYPLIILSIA